LAWRDEINDIAILRPIDNRGMKTALAFRPTALRAGDEAVVIGYPLSLPNQDGKYVSRKEPTLLSAM
jgi:S1-C subfamily serine protease